MCQVCVTKVLSRQAGFFWASQWGRLMLNKKSQTRQYLSISDESSAAISMFKNGCCSPSAQFLQFPSTTFKPSIWIYSICAATLCKDCLLCLWQQFCHSSVKKLSCWRSGHRIEGLALITTVEQQEVMPHHAGPHGCKQAHNSRAAACVMQWTGNKLKM